MRRRWLPSDGVVGLTIVLLARSSAAAATAAGEEASVDLRIECPALNESGRGALEARARAALAIRSPVSGTVAVSCTERTARIAWSPSVGSPGARTVSVTGDPAAFIDALLDALDELVADKPRLDPAPAHPSADVVASSNVPSAIPSAYAIVIGLESNLWSGVPLALGGHLGTRLRLGRAWSASLTGGLEWGAQAAQGVRATAIRAAFGIDYAITRQVRVCVAAAATGLTARDTAGSPAHGDEWSAGAKASARYAPRIGALGLSVGPEVELLASPLVVRVGTSEAFRIPGFVAGLVLDGEAYWGQ